MVQPIAKNLIKQTSPFIMGIGEPKDTCEHEWSEPSTQYLAVEDFNRLGPRMEKRKTKRCGKCGVYALLVAFLFLGCYEVNEPFECAEQPINTECEELPVDHCDGDTVVLFEQDEECNTEQYHEECKHGCVDEGEDGSVRCLDACEVNTCPTPHDRCESTVHIVSFEQSTCVLDDSDRGFNCVENPIGRWYCNCTVFEGTNDHCNGLLE